MTIYQLKVIVGCVDSYIGTTPVKHFLHKKDSIVQYDLKEQHAVGDIINTPAGFKFEVLQILGDA